MHQYITNEIIYKNLKITTIKKKFQSLINASNEYLTIIPNLSSFLIDKIIFENKNWIGMINLTNKEYYIK